MNARLDQRILSFNEGLELNPEILPKGVDVLNPFKGESAEKVKAITELFYQKYYADNHKRIIIFGINPGRMGAGLTGVPFSDTHCLENECHISAQGIQTRETSATFIYEVINAFGGPEIFYKRFFIGAVSPLGYVKLNSKNRYVNYNYYDDKELDSILSPFIVKWFHQQHELGMKPEIAFCLGTGKNFQYLKKLNSRIPLYKEIIPLEHPRYVMQYKSKTKQLYIDKFVSAFSEASKILE